MTDNHLTLFCLVDGEATANAFSIKIPLNDTVDDLKNFIKAKKTPEFDDIAADKLTLWCVSVAITDDDEELPISLDSLNEKKKLGPATRLSKVFPEDLPDETINIIVQRRPPGCGKTCAVIELLSQHWGFYFNATGDDWGSDIMVTLHSTVKDYLDDTRESSTVDRQANNAYARKTTLLLFLSRLLIFKHCLIVPGSNETFTSARWALLQVCTHVLLKDIFNILFLQLLKLLHHTAGHLLDLVRDLYEDAKGCIIKHGCLPRIKDDTRLLVVHDEAQILGDAFNGTFQLMSSSDDSPRPLLSPILHAFREIGQHQLTLVTCGTGLSINTLYWIQSSGSGLKDSSTTFEFMEFPGWTDQDSIKAYISRVRKCLLDDESSQALDERLPQKAIDMLFEKLENIVESIDQRSWRRAIEDTEDKLPQLVEHAFGRIKIFHGHAVTVLDEPFVSKAVENYFVATDPYFKKAVRRQMQTSTSTSNHGSMFEQSMMNVFSEKFDARPLSEWPHQPPISDICEVLVGKVEVVGWREPGLQQGTTHKNMSTEQFMDAHVNHQSTFNNMPVAPFYFPKSKPYTKVIQLFRGDWKDALSTVSAPKIEEHAKDFRDDCPDNVYISMIVAYPTKWSSQLPTLPDAISHASGVQQVVINVGDYNFSDIFPKDHVEFINRLKNARKRSAADEDDDGDDRTKKQRA
ncbi:hypothetical protein BGX23_006905 [Mortierella sp. AD031]|nr:hypothetical protein BGX23_006905 [Mortierella sp. AD031]